MPPNGADNNIDGSRAAAKRKAAASTRANANAKRAEAIAAGQEAARLRAEAAEKREGYVTNVLIDGMDMDPGDAAVKADSYLTDVPRKKPPPAAVNKFLTPWLAAREAEKRQALLEAEAVALDAEAKDLDAAAAADELPPEEKAGVLRPQMHLEPDKDGRVMRDLDAGMNVDVGVKVKQADGSLIAVNADVPVNKATTLASAREIINDEIVASVPLLKGGYLFMTRDGTMIMIGQEKRKQVVEHKCLFVDAVGGGVSIHLSPNEPGGSKMLLIDWTTLTIGKFLGNGAFGEVKKGVYRLALPSGDTVELPVAIKTVHAKFLEDAKAMQGIVEENARLAMCRSPYITKCYGTAENPVDRSLAIVMELCNRGDLKKRTSDGNFDILKGSKMCALPHAEMILLTLQMMLGLDYIHNNMHMVHRDLAARNIMLTSSEDGKIVAKLADLGMSRLMTEGKNYYSIDETRAKLPIQHCCPQILEKEAGIKPKLNADAAADMWAIGVTILEMTTNCSASGRKGPYLEEGTIRQVKTQKVKGADGKKYDMETIIDHLADVTKIRQFITSTTNKKTGVKTPGGRLHIPDECPVEVRVLMEALWSSKSKDRPTALQSIRFLLTACAPLLGEARAWEPDAKSAAKITSWLVGDLAIPAPRAMEMFGMFDYDTLMKNRSGDISDMLGADGAAFVLNSPIYKAMSRELGALEMLNNAVEQEPLKSALAKACEEAEKEEGGEAMQVALGEALDAARVLRAAAPAGGIGAEHKHGDADDAEGKDGAEGKDAPPHPVAQDGKDAVDDINLADEPGYGEEKNDFIPSAGDRKEELDGGYEVVEKGGDDDPPLPFPPHAHVELPQLVKDKLRNPNLKLTVDQQIECLDTCIQYGAAEAAKAEGRDLLMVIGNTGAGKSTMVNFIAGCTMERVTRKKAGLTGGNLKQKIVRTAADSARKEVMKIGHSNQSQTFTPDVAHDNATGFTFCDCPGFLDNRGPEINIANAVNIKQTIGMALSVRVIVLINYHSLVADRGRGIKELIHILRDLFGGSADLLVKHAPALLVGVSQAPKMDDDGDLREMDEFMDIIMDKSGLSEEQEKLIDALGANVFVSHPVEGMGNASWLTRPQLIECINTLDPITDPSNIFSTVLTAEDEQALHDIAGKMQTRIDSFMDERAYKEAASALDQFCVIDVIDNNRVTRLLQAVQVRESGGGVSIGVRLTILLGSGSDVIRFPTSTLNRSSFVSLISFHS